MPESKQLKSCTCGQGLAICTLSVWLDQSKPWELIMASKLITETPYANFCEYAKVLENMQIASRL